MKKICFFNFFHNGDLFHSKPFVKEVIDSLGKDRVLYAHDKDPKSILDLDIQCVRLQGLPNNIKMDTITINGDEIFLMNTWIGSYFDVYEGECTLNFNMKMWNDIYKAINENFNTNLVLRPVENYLPYVDYSAFDLTTVKEYLSIDKNKKILFSNGPALSGQMENDGNMAEIIIPLSHKYSNKTFILTYPLQHESKNVVHTEKIIKSQGCDLNEISYLSRSCDLIIGKNSGPFCFASTGENLNDPTKTFYAFGVRETDCFTHGLPKKCNYIFEKYESRGQLFTSIDKLISQL
jgi:hypothetical protein